MNKKTNSFILGSGSPRRIQLLKEQGYSFKSLTPNVPEIDTVQINSYNKAVYLAEQNNGEIVLSADTIVTKNGKILGKPVNNNDALKILMELNNSEHTVITAYTIAKSTNSTIKILDEQLIESYVRFGNFGQEAYLAYINTGEPFDKAGAYAIQGIGGRFINKINGSYSNIVGLPLLEVMQSLKKAGINYPWE